MSPPIVAHDICIAHIDRYLSALRGTIKFDLENRVDDEIDEVCDMDNRYYDLFDRGKKSRLY